MRTAPPAYPPHDPPKSRAWPSSFEATVWQSYLSGLKRHWGGALYRQVVMAAESCGADSVETLEAAMRDDPGYRLYAWLERRIQQMKWSGRWGFSTLVGENREWLASLLDEASSSSQASWLPPLHQM